MCLAAASTTVPQALLFDCDGVLVDTEKDGHRISFNETFDEVSSRKLLRFRFDSILRKLDADRVCIWVDFE